MKINIKFSKHTQMFINCPELVGSLIKKGRKMLFCSIQADRLDQVL